MMALGEIPIIGVGQNPSADGEKPQLQIRLGVDQETGAILIGFGQPVETMSLHPKQAIFIASAIIQKALTAL